MMPILYCDDIEIEIGEYLDVKLYFKQREKVIARIGMPMGHAEELLEHLSRLLSNKDLLTQ